MSVGIKESVELLTFVRDGLKALKLALKDNKLGFNDLIFVWELKDKATAAFTGLQALTSEVSDYDTAELKTVLGLVAEVVAEGLAFLAPAAPAKAA